MNTKRNKDIILLKQQGKTLKEIGIIYNISGERVRQIIQITLGQQILKENITKATKMGTGARDRYRELIRIRDKHTCQLCDWKWKEGNRKLDIHHLDEEITGKLDTKKDIPVSYDYEYPERCITLCHRCHLRLHHRILNKIKYDK